MNPFSIPINVSITDGIAKPLSQMNGFNSIQSDILPAISGNNDTIPKVNVGPEAIDLEKPSLAPNFRPPSSSFEIAANPINGANSVEHIAPPLPPPDLGPIQDPIGQTQQVLNGDPLAQSNSYFGSNLSGTGTGYGIQQISPSTILVGAGLLGLIGTFFLKK